MTVTMRAPGLCSTVKSSTYALMITTDWGRSMSSRASVSIYDHQGMTAVLDRQQQP
jgi:hypothetical protein